tara:strand:+ start:980 stop:1492 length:513 start_codon:yes stop_codon:yes gene_type:complete
MAWQNEMTRILRYILNDLDSSSYTYSDDRLEETIIVSAQLVLHEIDFDKDYTVDVDALTLTPDPTAATKDNAFINLVSLKSACLIASSELRTKGLDAVRVSDGASTIDTSNVLKGFEILSKDLCGRYEQAKIQYKAGNSVAGQAILTPYESPNFPIVHGEGHNTRTGYFE